MPRDIEKWPVPRDRMPPFWDLLHDRHDHRRKDDLPDVRREVRERTDELAARGRRRPGLAVILVGDDHASEIYVRNKRAACEECGIVSISHDLPHSTTQTELPS